MRGHGGHCQQQVPGERGGQVRLTQDGARMMTTQTGSGLFSKRQWSVIGEALNLTNRELEVVQGLFDDQTEAGMGETLGISSHTVHTHIGRIYEKLGVASRSGALVRIFAVAMEKRVVQLRRPTRRAAAG